jgi:hypothetical protein
MPGMRTFNYGVQFSSVRSSAKKDHFHHHQQQYGHIHYLQWQHGNELGVTPSTIKMHAIIKNYGH